MNQDEESADFHPGFCLFGQMLKKSFLLLGSKGWVGVELTYTMIVLS